MVCRKRYAFSITELILVVLFLGIFALIAVPRLNFAVITKQKTKCVAGKITTDLRRTRSLAIANAADNTSGFALNTTSSAGYEIENLDTSATVDSHTIDSQVSVTDGATFRFGPLGNLLAGSDTELTVAGSSKSFTITVISATGTIKCTEN